MGVCVCFTFVLPAFWLTHEVSVPLGFRASYDRALPLPFPALLKFVDTDMCVCVCVCVCFFVYMCSGGYFISSAFGAFNLFCAPSLF